MVSKTKTKRILEWIEAYSRLHNMDIEYFEKSINTEDKKLQKKYRLVSDQLNESVKNLFNKLP